MTQTVTPGSPAHSKLLNRTFDGGYRILNGSAVPGSDMDRFCEDSGPVPQDDLRDSAAWAEVAALCRRKRQPVIQAAGSSSFRVAVPLEPTGEAVAIGTVSGTAEELVSRLAVMTMQSLHQRSEVELQQTVAMDQCFHQITADFEELTFLRRLANQADLADVTCGLAETSTNLLPMLRSVIAAQSVFLLSGGETIASPGTSPEIIAEAHAPNHQPLSVVPVLERLDLDSAAATADQPLVCNRLAMRDSRSGAPVHSCVLLPVVHSGQCFAWMMAINKLDPPLDMFVEAIAPLDTPRSEYEFGTHEATLMSAVAAYLAAHANNSEMFREKEAMVMGVIRSMINAVDARDPYTCGHSERVARMARLLSERLGLDLSECERIYVAGLLHDVGKIGVPDQVLRKPGRLTDAEFLLVKQHPEIGCRILGDIKQLQGILPGVLHHHEAYDGNGYPHGLSGDDIPQMARILAVADTFDALTSDRPYRRGMPFEKAETILRENAGPQWDPEVIDALLRSPEAVRSLCFRQS